MKIEMNSFQSYMVKLAKLDISGVLNSRPVCQIVKVTTVFGLMLKMIRKLAKLVISIAKSLDSACLITKKMDAAGSVN